MDSSGAATRRRNHFQELTTRLLKALMRSSESAMANVLAPHGDGGFVVVGLVGSGGVTGSVPFGFCAGMVGGVPGRLGSEGAEFLGGGEVPVASSRGERRARSDVWGPVGEESVLGALRRFFEDCGDGAGSACDVCSPAVWSRAGV
jgi:hypothetical protein